MQVLLSWPVLFYPLPWYLLTPHPVSEKNYPAVVPPSELARTIEPPVFITQLHLFSLPEKFIALNVTLIMYAVFCLSIYLLIDSEIEPAQWNLVKNKKINNIITGSFIFHYWLFNIRVSKRELLHIPIVPVTIFQFCTLFFSWLHDWYEIRIT